MSTSRQLQEASRRLLLQPDAQHFYTFNMNNYMYIARAWCTVFINFEHEHRTTCTPFLNDYMYTALCIAIVAISTMASNVSSLQDTFAEELAQIECHQPIVLGMLNNDWISICIEILVNKFQWFVFQLNFMIFLKMCGISELCQRLTWLWKGRKPGCIS